MGSAVLCKWDDHSGRYNDLSKHTWDYWVIFILEVLPHSTCSLSCMLSQISKDWARLSQPGLVIGFMENPGGSLNSCTQRHCFTSPRRGKICRANDFHSQGGPGADCTQIQCLALTWEDEDMRVIRQKLLESKGCKLWRAHRAGLGGCLWWEGPHTHLGGHLDFSVPAQQKTSSLLSALSIVSVWLCSSQDSSFLLLS